MPTNIQRASFDSATEIMIRWTAPTDDGGAPSTLDYEVWSDDGDQRLGTEYYLIAASTSGLTEYNATVVTGKTYFFKIKTLNVVGKSALSLESAGMLAGSVPTEPLDLELVAQSQFQIKFQWTQPSDLGGIPLTHYAIYWDYGVLGTELAELFV